MNLRVLERQLRRLGVVGITQAENGKQAVDAEAGGDFDIVICDLQMPVMGGTEAAAHIVARYPQPGRRLPYLVALTADTTDGVDARCTLAGFHRVLTKPADMDTVRAALEAMALYHSDEGQRPSLVVPVTLPAP